MADNNGTRVPSESRPAYLDKFFEERDQRINDPALENAGVAPNYGQYALPHLLTYQSLHGSFSRAYRPADEALRHSFENARFMRNDPGVMECVEARQRSVALLDWHLEPEDDNSPEQAELCAQMTKILEKIVRFTEYRNNCLHAIWYGKYGIQNRYGWANVSGNMRLMPVPHREDCGWMPINGDKLVFRYDDGELRPDRPPYQLGIRVGHRKHIGSKINQHWTVEPTGRGLAYFLPDRERSSFVVHKHMIEDGSYEDNWAGEQIHGVGVRSRIYWDWFQKQESLAFLMEYLERSAGGIEIWTYPAGDATALNKSKEAAKERLSNSKNVIFFPKPMGDDGNMYDIQVIEPGMAGIESLKDILQTYYGHRIKRYILGQVLSSEAEATGLGSGVAELHFNTFLQIVKYDAVNLQETLTRELVRPIQDWNFPKSRGIDIRFKIETESPDVEKKLEAYRSAWEMGAKLRESDVIEMIGAGIPDPDDSVLQNPQIAQAEQQAAMGGMDPMQQMMGGMGPNQRGETPPTSVGFSGSDQMVDDLAQELYGEPDGTPGGSVAYVDEGGEWQEREMPEFDTGDRAREGNVDRFEKIDIGGGKFDKKDRYEYRWVEQDHPRDVDGTFASKEGGGQNAAATSSPDDGIQQIMAELEANSLGIPRHDMPQIVRDHQDAFLQSLAEQGITAQEVSRPVSELRGTQKEINPDKVAGMSERIEAEGDLKSAPPVLASSDGYILDGHHRWAAYRNVDPNKEMDLLEVDMPIDKLLDASYAFDDVQFAGVQHDKPVDKPKAKPSQARLVTEADRNDPELKKTIGRLGMSSVQDVLDSIGAPDDAEVILAHDPDPYNALVTADVRGDGYRARRFIKQDYDTGEIQITNYSLMVDESRQGQGIGTRMLAKQVEFASGHGIGSIRCEAARNDDPPPWTGYKVWPRLGYDAPFDPHGYKYGGVQKPPEVANAKSLQDVIATKAGREWWDKYGDDIEVKFDLSEGSKSRKVLDKYLRWKRAQEKFTDEYRREGWRGLYAKDDAEVGDEEGPEEPGFSPEEIDDLDDFWDDMDGNDYVHEDDEASKYAKWEEDKHPRDESGQFSHQQQVDSLRDDDLLQGDDHHQTLSDFFNHPFYAKTSNPEDVGWIYADALGQIDDSTHKNPLRGALIKAHRNWSKKLQKEETENMLKTVGDSTVVQFGNEHGQQIIVHPSSRQGYDTDPENKWQMSFIDPEGRPSGHTMFKNRDAALASAIGNSDWGEGHGPAYGGRNYKLQSARGGSQGTQQYARKKPHKDQKSMFEYDDSRGDWITIGGEAEGDKKHVGGTPVQVKDGMIMTGPAELEGKTLDSIDKDKRTHSDDDRKKDEPQSRRKSARQVPIDEAENALRGMSEESKESQIAHLSEQFNMKPEQAAILHAKAGPLASLSDRARKVRDQQSGRMDLPAQRKLNSVYEATTRLRGVKDLSEGEREAIVRSATGTLEQLEALAGPKPTRSIEEQAESVPSIVKNQLERLQGIRENIDAAATMGKRYEDEAIDNRQKEIDQAMGTIEMFREKAPGNDVDADAVLEHWGGLPDFTKHGWHEGSDVTTPLKSSGKFSAEAIDANFGRNRVGDLSAKQLKQLSGLEDATNLELRAATRAAGAFLALSDGKVQKLRDMDQPEYAERMQQQIDIVESALDNDGAVAEQESQPEDLQGNSEPAAPELSPEEQEELKQLKTPGRVEGDHTGLHTPKFDDQWKDDRERLTELEKKQSGRKEAWQRPWSQVSSPAGEGKYGPKTQTQWADEVLNAVNEGKDVPEEIQQEAQAVRDQQQAAQRFSPDDIPLSAATAAHEMSSFVPDQRGRQRQQEYANHLNSVADELSAYAQTPEQKQLLDEELARYRDNYKSRYMDLLGAESRTASSMITGASNFPTQRNRKRLDAAQKKWEALEELSKKGPAAIKRKLLAARNDDQLARDQTSQSLGRTARTLATLKAIKEGDDRFRGMDARSFSGNLQKRIQSAAKRGEYEAVKATLNEIAQFQGREGIPVFSNRNSIWNAHNVAKQAQLQNRATSGTDGGMVEYGDSGAEIYENRADDRVQIAFPGKPDASLRQALKSEGWRWSPRNGVWQRKLTGNATASAKRIMSGAYGEPTSDTTGQSSPDTSFVADPPIDVPTVRTQRPKGRRTARGVKDAEAQQALDNFQPNPKSGETPYVQKIGHLMRTFNMSDPQATKLFWRMDDAKRAKNSLRASMLRDVSRYFRQSEPDKYQWVTIGSEKSNPPGEKGGTPVYIGENGTIEKGPDNLEGKNVDKLDQDKEQSNFDMSNWQSKRKELETDYEDARQQIIEAARSGDQQGMQEARDRANAAHSALRDHRATAPSADIPIEQNATEGESGPSESPEVQAAREKLEAAERRNDRLKDATWADPAIRDDAARNVSRARTVLNQAQQAAESGQQSSPAEPEDQQQDSEAEPKWQLKQDRAEARWQNPRKKQLQLFDPYADPDPSSAPDPVVDHLPGATSRLDRLRQGKHSPYVGATQMDVSSMAVDPDRFQYKISGINRQTGVTDELEDVVQFDPLYGGQLLVWHDKEDGQTYVVNGHHRYELASRSPHSDEWGGEMSVYFVDAPDAQQARALGALANIAEGRGTATDAAKFLRDTGSSVEDMKSRNVSLKGKVAKNAQHLADLSDTAFHQLTTGFMDESRALAIGQNLKDHDKQNRLLRMVRKREDEGKNLTDSTVAEMARMMDVVPRKQGGGGGLFGDDFAEDLIAERGELVSSVRRALAGEARTFKDASSTRRGSALESTGTNVIDTEGNRTRAQQAAVANEDFNQRVNWKGDPLAELFNEYSQKLADNPRKSRAIKNELLERARTVLAGESGNTGATEVSTGSGSAPVSGGGFGSGSRTAAAAEQFSRLASGLKDRYGLTDAELTKALEHYMKRSR